jgi:hypothetical protein
MEHELQVLSSFDTNVQNAVDEELKEVIEGGETDQEKQRSKPHADLEAIRTTRYSGEQKREVLLPMYTRIRELFRDNLALAEPDTIAFYPSVCGRDELAKRNIAGGITPLQEKRVPTAEKSIETFRAHLDHKVLELTAELKSAKFGKRSPLLAKT